jgi:hypothetical protein
VKSFLTEYTTTLTIDREETALCRLNAGVLQGSLLLPILFLFYNTTLLEKVYQPDLPILLLGFADDINLLTYSKSTAVNIVNIETVHDQYLE